MWRAKWYGYFEDALETKKMSEAFEGEKGVTCLHFSIHFLFMCTHVTTKSLDKVNVAFFRLSAHLHACILRLSLTPQKKDSLEVNGCTLFIKQKHAPKNTIVRCAECSEVNTAAK